MTPDLEPFESTTSPTTAELALFAIKISLGVFALVWLYQDARARDANPVLWTVALASGALFFHWALPLVGVAIYLFVRPKGPLARCPHCGSGHLEWFTICPKCDGALKRDCPRCHTLSPYDAHGCQECGYNF